MQGHPSPIFPPSCPTLPAVSTHHPSLPSNLHAAIVAIVWRSFSRALQYDCQIAMPVPVLIRTKGLLQSLGAAFGEISCRLQTSYELLPTVCRSGAYALHQTVISIPLLESPAVLPLSPHVRFGVRLPRLPPTAPQFPERAFLAFMMPASAVINRTYDRLANSLVHQSDPVFVGQVRRGYQLFAGVRGTQNGLCPCYCLSDVCTASATNNLLVIILAQWLLMTWLSVPCLSLCLPLPVQALVVLLLLKLFAAMITIRVVLLSGMMTP